MIHDCYFILSTSSLSLSLSHSLSNTLSLLCYISPLSSRLYGIPQWSHSTILRTLVGTLFSEMTLLFFMYVLFEVLSVKDSLPVRLLLKQGVGLSSQIGICNILSVKIGPV